MLKKIFHSENLGQLFRYGLVTATSYVLLFAGTYLLVEKLGVHPSLAYFILITLIYLGVYASYTKFVFRSEFSRKRLTRFVIVTIIVWIVNNLFYNFLLLIIGVPYLWAIALNLLIFGGIRFITQKLFVFAPEAGERLPVILTFDLEFWHEGEWLKKYFPAHYQPEDFLIESVRPLLKILQENNQCATFFVTTPVLDKYPELIKEIAAAGHEIGSHSFAHQRLEKLSPETFRAGMTEQANKIEELIGRRPTSFRAPHFSLNEKTMWALPILAELGFQNDSSIFPIKTPEYGLDAPLQPYQITNQIKELPVAVAKFGPLKIPCAGGIYFRLLPLPIFQSLLNYVAEQTNNPPILYFHPHELCATTPRVKGPWPRTTLKYWSTKRSLEKFKKLAASCQFDSLENAFKI